MIGDLPLGWYTPTRKHPSPPGKGGEGEGSGGRGIKFEVRIPFFPYLEGVKSGATSPTGVGNRGWKFEGERDRVDPSEPLGSPR